MLKVAVNDSYCSGCGLCVDVCPRELLAFDPVKTTDEGLHPAKFASEARCHGCDWCMWPVHRCNCGWSKDLSLCSGCGKCTQVCPEGAIEISVVR